MMEEQDSSQTTLLENQLQPEPQSAVPAKEAGFPAFDDQMCAAWRAAMKTNKVWPK